MKWWTKHKTTSLLIVCAILIAVLHIFAVRADMSQGASSFSTKLFDLDQEYNMPTFYTSLILLLCAVQAFQIAMLYVRKGARLVWWGVSCIFLYLSLDEAFIIHEQAAVPIRSLLAIDNLSFFYHAWVLPAILFIGVFGALLLYMRKKQNVHITKNKAVTLLFFLACAVVLIEIIGTRLYQNQFAYRYGAVFAEEMLEIGITSIVYIELVKQKRKLSRKKRPSHS